METINLGLDEELSRRTFATSHTEPTVSQDQISVIIPTLNEARNIKATLLALAPMRQRGAEIIVVDGGSTDGTLRRARGLVDYALNCSAGRANQMMCGAAAASGNVLLFLHADTRLPEDWDFLILAALKNKNRRWGYFAIEIMGRSKLLGLIATLINVRSFVTSICTGDQAMFVRRDELVNVGGIPNLPLMEDVELASRLRARSRRCFVRPKARTSGRRWDQYGPWRTILLMWKLRLLYWLGVPASHLARFYK